MTLAELLPALHGLARSEKLLAIQVLAADVAREDGETLPPPRRPTPFGRLMVPVTVPQPSCKCSSKRRLVE